jgi:hypothetical protein
MKMQTVSAGNIVGATGRDFEEYNEQTYAVMLWLIS